MSWLDPALEAKLEDRQFRTNFVESLLVSRDASRRTCDRLEQERAAAQRKAVIMEEASRFFEARTHELEAERDEARRAAQEFFELVEGEYGAGSYRQRYPWLADEEQVSE